MTVSTNKLLILNLTFLLLSTTYSLSQSTVDDPLKKPEIWRKIINAPQDMQLWAAYVGKDLNSLSENEEEQIVKWCSSIKSNFDLHKLPEDTWMEVAEDHHYNKQQKVQMDLEYKIFHKQVEEHILNDSPILENLQANIETNFIIIEDILQLEFEEFGTQYVDYASTHKSGDYPKEKWLQEKNEELKELKMLNLEILKAQASK